MGKSRQCEFIDLVKFKRSHGNAFAAHKAVTMALGVISKAFIKSGEDPDYPNLGKLIIKDMKDHGVAQ